MEVLDKILFNLLSNFELVTSLIFLTRILLILNGFDLPLYKTQKNDRVFSGSFLVSRTDDEG